VAAGVTPLQCEQGATFQRLITWSDAEGTPVDLTACTATLEITVGKGSFQPPLLVLTELAGLTLGGPLGTIAIEISAAITSALMFGGRYELTVAFPGGTVVRLLEGDFVLSLSAHRVGA